MFQYIIASFKNYFVNIPIIFGISVYLALFDGNLRSRFVVATDETLSFTRMHGQTESGYVLGGILP